MRCRGSWKRENGDEVLRRAFLNLRDGVESILDGTRDWTG
jgi:hypothetical protein